MITEQQTELAVRFHPRRLGHANLFVSDLDRSMRFYHAVCGLEEVRREPAIRIGFLSNGNTHHDVGLVQISSNQRVGRDGFVMSRGDRSAAGLNHLGFEMENEVELVEAYRRARARGVEIHRTVDHLLSRSVYLPDPEGNVLEFYADVTKDWRSIFCPEREDLVTGSWTPGDPAPSTEPHYWPSVEVRRVEDAVFHPLRVTHAALIVEDFERALDFYTEVAGLELVSPSRAGAIATLRGARSDGDLTLVAAGPDRARGLHHVGFALADEVDLDGAAGRLREVGMALAAEVDHPAKRAVFVRDPDGLMVELFVKRSAAVWQNPGTDPMLF
jgi:catechol 2,3-dioxygenase